MIQLCQAMICIWVLAAGVWAQDVGLSSERVRPDMNNALIEGRIILPSGRSADLNIKIVLSNSTNALATLHTNKHGEFRFPDLGAGVYYVQAVGDDKLYEPVTTTVRLSRGQVLQLTLALRSKAETISRRSDAKLVSAAEIEQQIPGAARKEYEQAMKLAAKGQLPQAVERLQRALDLYPNYLAARNDLGAQLLKLRRLDEATEQFRLVLEKNPKYHNARFNLGLVLFEQKNYAASLGEFNQALAIDSSRPAAHFWLGLTLWQTGEMVGAERALTKALIMGGASFAAAHYYLAQIYWQRKDAVAAARALQAYLGEAPKGEFAAEAQALLKNLAAKP